MKYSVTLLSILLVLPLVCLGQQTPDERSIADRKTVKLPRDVMFIYQAEDKTSDALVYQDAKLESVDASWIESISMIKDAATLYAYGEVAKRGVIIIRFKSLDIISKELQMIIMKLAAE